MRSVGQLKDFEDVVATDANMLAHRVVLLALFLGCAVCLSGCFLSSLTQRMRR